MVHQVPLLLITLIICATTANPVEPSDVEALFSAKSSEEESFGDITATTTSRAILDESEEHESTEPSKSDVETDDDGVIVEETEDVETESDIAPKETSTDQPNDLEKELNATTATTTSTEDSSNEDAQMAAHELDLSDRRSWHVPMTGGDVIAPAIIPPDPNDTLVDETVTDRAVQSLNDPRNWNVPISAGDVIPPAIIPPEQNENSIVEATPETLTTTTPASSASTVVASLFSAVVFIFCL